MKMRTAVVFALAALAIFSFSSCEITVDFEVWPDGAIVNYTGLNSSSVGISPNNLEITLYNQLSNVDIFAAYLVDNGTGTDYSTDMLGAYGVGSIFDNTIVGVPENSDCSLELTFADGILGTVVYNGLNTDVSLGGGDYDIYVRMDTGGISPIETRSANSTVKEFKTKGIVITAVCTPRQ